ncbi:MAG: hypothetical protein JSV90_07700 [Methanobacteriota archaeon]|nr:MAG: hypothetical protein JSV90_07700 [Euryarchaeota archaeon]
MIKASVGLKMTVAMAAAALFLTFSNLSFSLLVPGAVGVVLVLFGIIIRYRPAAMLGLFVDLSVAALSIDIVTLADMDVWQTSVLGLLLPTSLLAWSALLSEDTDSYVIRFRTRAFATALAVGALFAVTIPVSAAIIGTAVPSAVNTISTMAEVSILFTVVAVTALVAVRSGEGSSTRS